MKPGWYWATNQFQERQIVQVTEGNSINSSIVWVAGCEREDSVSNYTNFVPVACEGTDMALEAFDKHDWPFHILGADGTLIQNCLEANRENKL